MERLYPRTYFHAAVHAAGQAASEVHDRAVGRVGVYHLFRLPETLETEILRMSPDSYREFFVVLRDILGYSEKLMELLNTLCGEAREDNASGARKIGTSKDLMTEAGLKKTALVYKQAFAQGKPSFPYFTNEPI